MAELWFIDGTLYEGVHDRAKCKGRSCSVHNPSDDHMAHLPLRWREDRGFFERHCSHGTGHPQIDDVIFQETNGREIGSHGCCPDSCCYKRPGDPRESTRHNTVGVGW